MSGADSDAGAGARGNGIRRHLRRRSLAGNRGGAAVFRGREDVLERLLGMARQDPADPASDRVALIEGGPGAGKTALLREVARRLRAAGVPALFLKHVPRGRQVARIRARLAASGDARAATGAPDEVPRAVPLAVLIDEIQRLAPRGAACGLVRELGHDRSIPALLVCAGAPRSRRTLARAGIARIDHVAVLGPLPPAVTLDLARRAFDAARARGLAGSAADAARWARAVAAASAGWPRHLECYLAASWESLLEQDPPSLATGGLETALRLGRALCDEYPRDGRLRPLRVIRRRLAGYR